MRLVLRLIPLATGIALTMTTGTAQQAGNPLAIRALAPQDLRTWDSFVTSSVRSGELRLLSARVDPALPNRSIERFQQFENGVRVWGADVVRDSETGMAQAIFGEVAQNLSLSTTPALSTEQGRDLLLASAGPSAVLLRQPELVILRTDSGEYRLTYTAVVSSGETAPARVFLDASSGAELLRISEIRTQAEVVTGQGVLGDRKKISTFKEGDTYFADDRLRPPSLLTFDMKGNLTRTRAVVELGLPPLPSDRASEGDKDWANVAQVDAHVHVGWTYDYYFKRFGRRGLDDRDRPIRIVTNAVSQIGALTLPDSLLEWAVNAFWCDSCGPDGTIFFGNGIPEGVTFGGQRITYLSGALDIAAHELTHAVGTSTSNLIYRNESGALDESFADIIGTSVEFYFQPAGAGRGRADYIMGEDVIYASASGTHDGLRSMEDPGIFGDPDHYSKRFLGSADNGGVHINAGIPNNAFYLAVEGGTNRTSRLPVQGVGGANREQVEKVFYRAFAFLLPSSATFATARAATIQSARDLYGSGSNVERAITDAWTAVGVN